MIPTDHGLQRHECSLVNLDRSSIIASLEQQIRKVPQVMAMPLTMQTRP